MGLLFRSDNRQHSLPLGPLIFIILLVGVCVFDYYIGFTGETTVKDTVIGKERVNKYTNGHQDSYYVIYGEKATYQITDSWLKGRFDSSDMYGHIQENHSYEFHVIGKRIPILSHYQNIMEYKELK